MTRRAFLSDPKELARVAYQMATDVEPFLTLIHCSVEDFKASGARGAELCLALWPVSASAAQFRDLSYRFEPIARCVVRPSDDCKPGEIVAP